MTPAESKEHQPKITPSRREFLLKLGVVLNTIAAAMVGIPIVGFVFASVIKSLPRVWFSLGPVSQFPENATRMAAYLNPHHRSDDGQTATIPCWVRRMSGDQFRVFSVHCTHLGCPVRWFEQSQLFLCPCHGGVFYADGAHAAGPPPRGLYVIESKVQNGELMIKAGVMPSLSNPG